MLIFLLNFLLGSAMAAYPHDFVSLTDLCSTIEVEASYATTENFTGEVVPGYLARKALMARIPALALCEAQKEAASQGLSLKIFDGYRPAKAVAFFQTWAQRPESHPQLKEIYYPSFTRQELFEQGYIAKRSSHSRGSAVDLTLVDSKSGKELDMGSAFDFFDSLSNTEDPRLTATQSKNRQLLKTIMESNGFKNFSQEWWHYSFKAEPHPEQYFDFDVK